MLVLISSYCLEISSFYRLVEQNAAVSNILTSELTPMSFSMHGPSTMEERSDDDLGSLLQASAFDSKTLSSQMRGNEGHHLACLGSIDKESCRMTIS